MCDTKTQTSLESLRASILEDGVIDAGEVATLRVQLYADGVIDRPEADFLFELNDAVSGKENDGSWQAFFVEAIADHLLRDDDSPGVVDEAEGDWLVSRIQGDGEIDSVERALLDHLRSQAKEIRGKLRFELEMASA